MRNSRAEGRTPNIPTHKQQKPTMNEMEMNETKPTILLSMFEGEGSCCCECMEWKFMRFMNA